MLRKLIALSLLLCFIPFCLGVAEPVTLSTSEAWRESMIDCFDSLEIDLTFTKEALGTPYPDGWEIYRAKSDDEDWLLLQVLSADQENIECSVLYNGEDTIKNESMLVEAWNGAISAFYQNLSDERALSYIEALQEDLKQQQRFTNQNLDSFYELEGRVDIEGTIVRLAQGRITLINSTKLLEEYENNLKDKR